MSDEINWGNGPKQPAPKPKFDFAATPTRRKQQRTSSIADVFDFSFRRYATPAIIRILWAIFFIVWLCGDVVALAIGVLTEQVKFSDQTPGMATAFVFLFFAFVVWKVSTLLVARVVFECFLVLFDIRDALQKD